jgi:hypothetical protein
MSFAMSFIRAGGDWRSFEPFVNAFVEPLAPHLLAARRLAA